MPLLQPTTSQLMTVLPSWPMGASASDELQGMSSVEWQSKHVPWVWTPQEFEMQTQMLMANDCPARDMLAWLVHGVRWAELGSERNSFRGLEERLNLWDNKGAYLRAWIDGTKGLIADEVVENLCGKMSWHPVWGTADFAKVVDDFSWARELRLNPRKVDAARKSLSFLGSIELCHATPDHAFRYACASFMAKQMQWDKAGGVVPVSSTHEVINCHGLSKLSPFVQRSLLVGCAASGNPRSLEPQFLERIHSIWANNISMTEQAWWENKARTLSFLDNTNIALLEQGVHPLLLIYRERAQDLALFKELNPDAFCSGYVLQGLLAQNNSVALELPDLHDDMAP